MDLKTLGWIDSLHCKITSESLLAVTIIDTVRNYDGL